MKLLSDQVETVFAYKHLPAHLQEISKPFYDLAVNTLPRIKPGVMREKFIEHLWEAKNAATITNLLE